MPRSHIDKGQRDIAVGQLLQQRLLNAEGHHGHALGLALHHAADAALHALGVVVGGADQDLIALLDGHVLKALNQLREEGVGDLRDDQPQKAAAPADQGAGLCVRQVVERLDGLPDALSHLGVDGGDVIDGAGDGSDGDVRHLRHGMDVHVGGGSRGAPF